MIRSKIQKQLLAGLQLNVKNVLLLGKEVGANQHQQTMASERVRLQEKLHPNKSAKLSRSKRCVKEIVLRWKSVRVQNMSKSKNHCQICSLVTCSEHAVQICTPCYKLSQLRNSQQ